MPTAVFGWTGMLRSERLRTCTRAELGLIHQCVTVLASIKECQNSSCGMFLMVSAIAIFDLVSANVTL